jgi:hypothetical protein
MNVACSTISLALALGLAAAMGCGAVTVGFVGDSGAPDVTIVDAANEPPPAPTIFPPTPIIDGNAPSNSPTLFGAPDSGTSSGGPCLAEPEIGTLMPKQWLRPRFRWQKITGENLFELRVHVASEKNDLLVYTTNPSWTMPLDMWTALSNTVGNVEVPLTVSVRGADFDGTKLTAPPALGSFGDVNIAPVEADGQILYWALLGPGPGVVKGFTVRDESVQAVVTPSQVGGQCIGCHSSEPDLVVGDGAYMGMTASTDAADGAYAFIALRAVADPTKEPPFLTSSAKQLLARQEQFLPTFSKAHSSQGDRIMLSIYNPQPWPAPNELIWTNLEATSTTQGVGWGVIARNGDPNAGVTSPAFSHDGKTIVYSSGSSALGGTSQTSGDADLYSVPYANGAGGAAKKLSGGANDPAFSAVYPTLSPDDVLIAYARMPRNTVMIGSVAPEEVWVAPASGGTPTRLAANDPAACTGVTSPGINNSWPHWSPRATTVGTKTYYFLIFSSWRADLTGRIAQLYVSAVVVDGGKITTYPALYVWNQPSSEHNATAAWDVFDISPPK